MTQEIRDITLEIERDLATAMMADSTMIYNNLRCIRSLTYKIDEEIERLKHPEEEKLNGTIVNMSQGEALQFAKGYLRDNRNKYGDSNNTWELARECILISIIPYIYGEVIAKW